MVALGRIAADAVCGLPRWCDSVRSGAAVFACRCGDCGIWLPIWFPAAAVARAACGGGDCSGSDRCSMFGLELICPLTCVVGSTWLPGHPRAIPASRRPTDPGIRARLTYQVPQAVSDLQKIPNETRRRWQQNLLIYLLIYCLSKAEVLTWNQPITTTRPGKIKANASKQITWRRIWQILLAKIILVVAYGADKWNNVCSTDKNC